MANRFSNTVSVLLNRTIMLDCNGNGIPDATDIANGTSLDCNGNGIPDECEPDFDGDGIIDASDDDDDNNGVLDVVDVFPMNSPGLSVDCAGRPRLDLNMDCLVDGQDLQLIVDEVLSQ